MPVARRKSYASIAAAVPRQQPVMPTIEEEVTDELPCVLPPPIPTGLANSLIESANHTGKPWHLDRGEGMIFDDNLTSPEGGSSITSEAINECFVDYERRFISHGKLRTGEFVPSTFMRQSWTHRYFQQQLFDFKRARAAREGWADERGCWIFLSLVWISRC